MAGAARTAAVAGHTDVAIAVLKSLKARDRPAAAAAVLEEQSVATEVLTHGSVGCR
jgi:hypothetical protein